LIAAPHTTAPELIYVDLQPGRVYALLCQFRDSAKAPRHSQLGMFGVLAFQVARRTNELGALAGFEKSGHFFFNAPLGRGYDDGLISAIAICEMLDRAPGKSMADLKNALPKTWSSPTMSPHCSDETKYGIVDSVVKHFEAMQNRAEKVAGQKIRDLVTVNGVRVTVEDGSWGLVRASSNKPELVVVVESPVSEQRMRDMFEAMDSVLRTHPEVGEYNQKI